MESLRDSLIGSFPLKLAFIQASSSQASSSTPTLSSLVDALQTAQSQPVADILSSLLTSLPLHRAQIQRLIPVPLFLTFLIRALDFLFPAAEIPLHWTPYTESIKYDFYFRPLVVSSREQTRSVVSAIRLALALLSTQPMGVGLEAGRRKNEVRRVALAVMVPAVFYPLAIMATAQEFLPQHQALALELLAAILANSRERTDPKLALHSHQSVGADVDIDQHPEDEAIYVLPQFLHVLDQQVAASLRPATPDRQIRTNLPARAALRYLLAIRGHRILPLPSEMSSARDRDTLRGVLSSSPDPDLRSLVAQLLTAQIKASEQLKASVNPVALQVLHAVISDFATCAAAVQGAIARLPVPAVAPSSLHSSTLPSSSSSSSVPSSVLPSSSSPSPFALPPFESDLALSIAPRTAFVLNSLLVDNLALQLAADDLRIWSVLFPAKTPTPRAAYSTIADHVRRYRKEVPTVHDWSDLNVAIRQLEGVLLIAATLMTKSDVHKQRAVDIQLLPLLHLILSEDLQLPGLRVQAMQCMRSLTRSVSILKTSIADQSLDSLLYSALASDQEDEQFLEIALMAGSNMVCQYDPAKIKFASSGALPKVLGLISSAKYSDTVRLNALRLAAMFAYKADLTLCKPLLRQLTFSQISKFCDIGETSESTSPSAIELKEKAMHLLCNITSTSPEHGALVVGWVGVDGVDGVDAEIPVNTISLSGNVSSLLALAGQGFSQEPDTSLLRESTTLHSMGIIAALALCDGKICDVVLEEMCCNETSSLKWLSNYFTSKSQTVRIRCLWIMLNLMETAFRQQSSDPNSTLQYTAKRLKEAGYEDAMEAASLDDNGELREIAKAVKEHFSKLGDTLPSENSALPDSESSLTPKRQRLGEPVESLSAMSSQDNRPLLTEN